MTFIERCARCGRGIDTDAGEYPDDYEFLILSGTEVVVCGDCITGDDRRARYEDDVLICTAADRAGLTDAAASPELRRELAVAIYHRLRGTSSRVTARDCVL